MHTFQEISRLKTWSKIFVFNPLINIELKPLAKIKIERNLDVYVRHFYSQIFNNSFDESWGTDEVVYTDEQDVDYNLREFNPILPQDSNIIMIFIHQRRATSKTVAEIIVNVLEQEHSVFWQKILTDFQNKEVTISYSDRYVSSKFIAMIVLQFIQKISQILNLKIENIKLNFHQQEIPDRACIKIWDKWESEDERKNFIRNAILDMNLVTEENFQLNIERNTAHYRQLVIETDRHVLTIQPDGGLQHGWSFYKSYGNYEEGDYDTTESDEEMSIINTTGDNGIQYIITYE